MPGNSHSDQSRLPNKEYSKSYFVPNCPMSQVRRTCRVTIHVKIVLLISCGFVEPASFVFSGEKSKSCDFNQTWKQALSRALYCALWCPADELPE